MEKINYGYIRKVDTANHKLLDFYSYPELLTNPMLRSRLKIELEHSPERRLFCACSEHNDRPVYINDSYSLYFPEGSRHAGSCVSYLTTLMEYVNHPLIKELVSTKPCLQVAFKWAAGSRLYQSVITNAIPSITESKRLSLDDFVKYTNLCTFYRIAMEICHGKRSSYPSADEFLQMASFELGKCTFIDQSEAAFSITERTLFRPHQALGTVSFLLARILYVNSSYKSRLYFTAKHLTGETMFEMDHGRWESLEPDINQDLPLYICGFVRSVEGTIYRKGRRDSVTHTYQGAVSKKKEAYHMLSFVLFHANTYGLLCCSKDMYIKTNELCAQRAPCYLPFFPVK